MVETKNEGPTIVAIAHTMRYMSEKEIEYRIGLITKYLNGLPSGKRTVYIEASEELGKIITDTKISILKMAIKINKDPFYEAAILAKSKGWNVVGLDRDSLRKVGRKIKVALANDYFNRFLTKLDTYRTFDAREKSWALKLKLMKPKPQDVIIMHPAHVSGFMKYAEFHPKKVEWLEKPPTRLDYFLMRRKASAERLSEKALRKLTEERNRERKKRLARIMQNKVRK